MSIQTAPQTSAISARCEGIAPLTARLEAWHTALLANPGVLGEWLDTHRSPLNILDLSPMARNVRQMRAAAANAGVELGIYFARNANRTLTVVDQARELELGIGLESEHDLQEVLQRGIPGKALVMTAAVKPEPLLALCIQSGTTVVIDNEDELRALARLAESAPGTVPIALRLAPDLGPSRPQTRFGMTMSEALVAAGRCGPGSGLRIDGVHFHVNGCAVTDRVTAISQALSLADALVERGHEPRFIDIGGGIPVSHIDSAAQWEHFWREHRKALLGQREPLTFEGNGLGLTAHYYRLIGEPALDPPYQSPVRGEWLTDVLTSRVPQGSVAGALRDRALRLHCEPGRALLDGCGLTAARVEFRKQRRDGASLVGVAMNRTRSRFSSDAFLADPLLLRTATDYHEAEEARPIEGYLVGSYGIEDELLTLRRMRFPDGVLVGDILVFPNTAGYQVPLARNLIVDAELAATLDASDH